MTLFIKSPSGKMQAWRTLWFTTDSKNPWASFLAVLFYSFIWRFLLKLYCSQGLHASFKSFTSCVMGFIFCCQVIIQVVGFSHCYNLDTKDQPKSLVPDPGGTARDGPHVDSNEFKQSPKRPNDENITNTKKKVSVIVTVLPHYSIFSWIVYIVTLCLSSQFLSTFL